MIVLCLMACLEYRDRTPAPINTLEELRDLPMGRAVLLEAEAHPQFASYVLYQTQSGGPTWCSLTTVVPLTERGGDPTTHPVQAWAYYNGHIFQGNPIKPMVLYFENEFNREQVRGSALGRRPDTEWNEAVKDAESRWGLVSHPDARVVHVPFKRRFHGSSGPQRCTPSP